MKTSISDLRAEMIQRAIVEAIAAERERCAAVCERLAKSVTITTLQQFSLNQAAAAIRKGS